MIGERVKRREDPRLLTGQGQYMADLTVPGMLHAALLRTPHAHARIKKIDVSGALKVPGAVAVFTGADLKQHLEPLTSWYDFAGKEAPTKAHDYPLAVDKVRYVGEPVAVVAASDRYVAEDAMEEIQVEYEPLPPVVDAEEAMKEGSPLLFEEAGSNIYWQGSFNYGDVDRAFAEADLVVKDRLYFHRFSSTPLEGYAILANYQSVDHSITIWGNFQSPAIFRLRIARSLNIPMNRVRLITPSDVGGGFGLKMPLHPWAILMGFVSMRLRKPVKWVEDRLEHLAASHHGTEQISYAEFAAKKDGTILGLRAKIIQDEGGYVHMPEPLGVIEWSHIPQGCYRFRNLSMDCSVVLTNKCPVAPNRGYGRMQHQFLLERMIDRVARELKMDPVEIRLKNFIQPEEFPYESTNGALYDSGNYPECVRKAKEAIGWEECRKKQEEARKEGRYIGLGLVSIMDPGVTNMAMVGLFDKNLKMTTTGEAVCLKIDASGTVTIIPGSWGQGHETTCAQIVAHEFGIPYEHCYVVPGVDTATHPMAASSGTYASRFAVTISGAIQGAAGKLKTKMIQMAAHLWREDPANLEFRDGKVIHKNDSSKAIPMAQLSALSVYAPAKLPPGMDLGMEATHIYNYPKATEMDDNFRANFAATYANVVHAVAIEVEPGTGQYKLLKYVVVHDAGTLINPMIADGQVHGAVAHSLGAAMLEEFVYDKRGQLLSGTYSDYMCPRATEIPDIHVEHVITPSPFTAYGVKGMGEGSGPVPALLAQALEDALKPLGEFRITWSRHTPEKVFGLIHGQR